MKKIYATLETGFVNAYYEEYFEFDDNVTDEEIDNEVEEWAKVWAEEIKATNNIAYSWEEID